VGRSARVTGSTRLGIAERLPTQQAAGNAENRECQGTNREMCLGIEHISRSLITISMGGTATHRASVDSHALQIIRARQQDVVTAAANQREVGLAVAVVIERDRHVVNSAPMQRQRRSCAGQGDVPGAG